MDEMLKTGLQPNETLLWRGKPESFETLDKTHKKKFIVAAAIGLFITLLVGVLPCSDAERCQCQAGCDSDYHDPVRNPGNQCSGRCFQTEKNGVCCHGSASDYPA